MHGFVAAGVKALLVAADDVCDEDPARAQQAAHLAEHPLQVVDVVQGVAKDGVQRGIGEHDLVEVALQDVLIVGAWIEVDPHGEVAELV